MLSLTAAVDKISKDTQIIVNIIQLILCVLNKLRVDRADMDLTKFDQRLNDLVRNWLFKVGNESLLINFGIRQKDNQMMEQNDLLKIKFEDEFDLALESFGPIDYKKLEDIMNEFIYIGTDKEAEIYQHLMDLNYEEFRQKVVGLFKIRLTQQIQDSFSGYLIFYHEISTLKFGQHDTIFKSECRAVLLDKLKNSIDSEDFELTCDLLQRKVGLLGDLIGEVLECNTSGDKDRVLIHILGWKPFLAIVKKNNLNCFLNSNLTMRCIQILEEFVNASRLVTSGQVSIDLAELLYRNQEFYMKILEFIIENSFFPDLRLNSSNISFLRNLLKYRKKEIDEFYVYWDNIKLFLQFCQNFERLDAKSLIRKLMELETMSNWKILKLNDICMVQTAELNNVNSFDALLNPKIIYFPEVTSQTIKTIIKINNLDRSKSVLLFNIFR